MLSHKMSTWYYNVWLCWVIVSALIGFMWSVYTPRSMKLKWGYISFNLSISPCNCLSVHRIIMMTSSNGNIFRATGSLCWEFTGHQWISSTKPVMRSFDVFFDLHLNKQAWVNNQDASNLRRRHAHYDVTVMMPALLLLSYVWDTLQMWDSCHAWYKAVSYISFQLWFGVMTMCWEY